MKVFIYTLITLLLSGTALLAQDYHMSQYDATTLYMNPALTGMYGDSWGDYKIYNDYRSQWASLAQPYATIYVAYDMPIKIADKDFGVGGYIIDNRSPAGGFNTLTVMPSIAYNITGNGASKFISGSSSGKHYLTTGLQLGFFYKDFNPTNFTYDDQYSSDQGTFDQSIPSGESFAKTSMIKFDVNLGIYYKYIEKGKMFHPFAGFSIQHVTEPNESFTSYKDILPMRFNLNGGCDVAVNEQLKLVPTFLYMNQASVPEEDIGLIAYYKIQRSAYTPLLGCDYRFNDAIVVHIGIKQNEHVFRFSYDINTSYLNNFSGGRGAWEFSLILTGIKGAPFFAKGQSRF
jgi:type IX secretion system PorP/SprF family membrane protein